MGIPQLIDCVAIGQGKRPEEPSVNYNIGKLVKGSTSARISIDQMPAHSHPVTNQLTLGVGSLAAQVTPKCAAGVGDADGPQDSFFAPLEHDAGDDWATSDIATHTMAGTNIALSKQELTLSGEATIEKAGQAKPFDTRMPSTSVIFAICYNGKAASYE